MNNFINQQPSPPPQPMSTTFGVCSQCGFSHPPLGPGEICPMAKITTKSGEEIQLENFFSGLKSFLLEFVKNNDIKNQDEYFKKLLQNIIKLIQRGEDA